MRTPARAEVWGVYLNPVRGHEQGGHRPCIVLSDDIYNFGGADKHIVVPFTSKSKAMPYHVDVLPPEGGLRVRSFVLCDDIRNISRARFGERLGAVSDRTMDEILDRVRMLIGIPRG